MNDVWVWDVYRNDRFVKSVRVLTFKDVNVEVRGDKDLELPKELALDEVASREPEPDVGRHRVPVRLGRSYDACCGPIHDGAPAPTAEALMRSRFSAFALGLTPYLLTSWHPSTRPASLEPDAGHRVASPADRRRRGGRPG